MAPFYLLWLKGAWSRGTFQWRWSIPLIGCCLLIADFLYFTAITYEDALISVISPVRRASVVITFLGGIYLHGEKNVRIKAICIGGLLLGITLQNADIAHGSYNAYVEVIRRNDAEVGKLWETIQKDPELRATTTIVICPEFGRDANLNQRNGLVILVANQALLKYLTNSASLAGIILSKGANGNKRIKSPATL